QAIEKRVEFLLAQGDARIMPLLRAMLRDRKVADHDRAAILKRYAELEPRQARWFARHFLSAKDERLLVTAALLCLPTADGDRARRVLGDYVRNAGRDRGYYAAEALDGLLADGSPESLKQARRVFEGVALERRVKGNERGRLLRRMAEENVIEAYSF